MNNCIDELCPFCNVIQNFEHKRLVTALKNMIVKNSNLGEDITKKNKRSEIQEENVVFNRKAIFDVV